jgi:predicted dehydrogenase
MNAKINIGIVGAGKRVHDMYAPVLNANSDINISGFWNRDILKGQKLTDAFGYKRFSDLEKLAKASDALIIVVNSSALSQVEMNCITFGKPLMAETPVWTKEIVNAAQKANIPFQIAEQTPWLPTEQFKVDMMRSPEFGKPHTVVNDFRTFEYHGLAQLRRYIGFDKIPTEVCGMSHGVPMTPFVDGNGVEQRGHIENWDSGQIRFSTGELAIYNFSSLYNRCKYRQPRSLRIYTECASIVNDDDEFKIRIGHNDASISYVSTEIEKQSPEKTNNIIGCHYDMNGKLLQTYAWDAQTQHLNDQQEALKVLVDNFSDHIITNGAQKLKYDVSQGWIDFNLLMAIRHSGASKNYIRR